MILEILLFTASLLLHVSVPMGTNQLYEEYGGTLLGAAVIVGIPTSVFITNSFRWVDQIKTCPKWMWQAALTLGVYALFIACSVAIFSEADSTFGSAFAVSGFPLGMDAICVCILFSALSSGCLNKTEIVRRTGKSLIFVSLGVVVFLAYRAGYLPHHSIFR
jgi:uncharacterized membrane protein